MHSNTITSILQPGTYQCSGGCKAELTYPGMCAECYREATARDEQRRLRQWIHKLPKRHRDVTWASLPTLRRADGGPRVPAERIEPARKMLESGELVLVAGPLGWGKSTLAAAHLRAVAERDMSRRVRWMPAVSLLSTTPVEVLGESDAGPSAIVLALTADMLVLDDLGQELDSAQEGSGLLAQRKGPASRVIEHRFAAMLPTVITTGLTSRDVASLYGGGVHRRVTDGAVIIGQKHWASKDGRST